MKHILYGLFLGFLLLSNVVKGQSWQKTEIIFKLRASEYDVRGRVVKVAQIPAKELLKGVLERRFPNERSYNAQERTRSGQKFIDLSLIYTLKIYPNDDADAILTSLKKDSNVEYAVFSRKFIPLSYIPNDPGANSGSAETSQYYLAKIKAYEAWDIQKGNSSSIIGIIDYGFQTNHEDLIGNLHPDYRDLGDNDTDLVLPHPYSYHGGAVAGIAAATPDNNKGIAGVGFNCQYLPVKVIADDFSAFNWEASLMYLADRNVKVVNMSFGYCFSGGCNPAEYGEPSQYEQDLMNYMVLNRDIAMVASAGNGGGERVWYPASYDNVLSVASTDNNDVNGQDYNYFVDLAAPGQSVYTTYFNCCAYGGAYNNNTSYFPASGISGTSFSSPQVSAAVALVRTQFPTLTAQQAMARVRASADDVSAQNPSINEKLGKGRLNIFKAVSAVSLKAVQMENQRNIFLAGESVTFSVSFLNLLDNLGNLQVSLSSTSPMVTVSDANATLGAFSTLQRKDNANDTFSFQISPATPNGTVVTLRLGFQDGAFSDFQYFNIIIQNNLTNIDINAVNLSLGNKGQVAPPSQFPFFNGFTYDQNNAARLISSNSGFIVATQSSVVANTISNYAGGVDANFININGFQTIRNANYQEATCTFKDDNAGVPTIGLEIQQKTYAFANENYIILEYKLQNKSGATLPELYVGLFSDMDIGDYTKNKTDFDNTNSNNLFGYVYETSTNKRAGISLLTNQPTQFFGLDNNNIDGLGINLVGGFSPAEKFQAVSNGIAHPQAGASGQGNDVSVMLGGKVLNIANNQTVTVAFAVSAATTAAELSTNLAQAKAKFIELNKSASPVISNALNVCLNGSIMLNPTANTSNFEFYENTTAGNLLGAGATLTLNNLTTNKTVAILHKDPSKLYPSDAFIVNISVLPAYQADFEVEQKSENTYVFTDKNNTATTSVWDFGDGQTATGNRIEHSFADYKKYVVSLKSTSKDNCEAIITKEIEVLLSETGDISKQIKVYPNPAEREIFIQNTSREKMGLQVFNVLGQKVLEATLLPASNSAQNAVGLVFSQGIYIFRLSQGEKTSMKKISIR